MEGSAGNRSVDDIGQQLLRGLPQSIKVFPTLLDATASALKGGNAAAAVNGCHWLRRSFLAVSSHMTQKQRVMQGNSAVERALAALMKWMEPVTRKLYKLLGQMCTSDDDVLAVAAFRTGVHLLTEWDPLQRQITKLQRLLALLEPSICEEHIQAQVLGVIDAEIVDPTSDLAALLLTTLGQILKLAPTYDVYSSDAYYRNVLSILLKVKCPPSEEVYQANFQRQLKWSPEETVMASTAAAQGTAKSRKRKLSKAFGPLDGVSFKDYRRRFQKVWLRYLDGQLPKDAFLMCLRHLPDHVLPVITQPLMLADAFTSAYEHGGVVSVYALSGLFWLITKHNLDYPRYFDKLYALITPETTHSKYRSKFFELLESSLNTAHLPAYLVAAFLKRMLRVAQASPPPAAVFLVSLAYNTLKAHPACSPLIHRAPAIDRSQDVAAWVAELQEACDAAWAGDAPVAGQGGAGPGPVAKESAFRQPRPSRDEVAAWVAELLGESADKGYSAPAQQTGEGSESKQGKRGKGTADSHQRARTDGEEQNALEAAVHKGFDVYQVGKKPPKSNALYSSLWELKNLRQHYFAPVASLARGFEGQKKLKYETQEFREFTYSSMFEAHVDRREGAVPPLINPGEPQPEYDLFLETVAF